MKRRLSRPKRQIRKPHRQNDYQSLEPRQLLATIASFDAANSQLNVSLTAAGDVAEISVNTDGEVLINGSRDTDSGTGAIDPVLANTISVLNVEGGVGIANQSLILEGNFSVVAANLVDVNALNLTSVAINGSYGMTGDLTVVLEGLGGGVTDGVVSTLFVEGDASITARNNEVVLDDNVDFRGNLNVSTLGGFDVSIDDATSLQLANVNVSGDLNLTAGGAITDAIGSMISVEGDGDFTADSVTLGEDVSDVVNFARTRFLVGGQVELHEDSNIIFGTSTIGSLIADTPAGIFDGRTTNVFVAGNANLNADAVIRLGEHGLDTFNAGSLTLNSDGHVHIFEDSDTIFVGDTVARTMDITSLGDVSNVDDASITTSFATGFEGDNITLGAAMDDSVSLGGVYFFSLGDIVINENDNIFVIDQKNRADRLSLISTGAIADADDAIVTVDRLATFVATNVTFGDSLDDGFNAGSIRFDVDNEFFLREDSDVNIAGDNSATDANIGAFGDINSATNGNETLTTMEVTDVARFIANNVDVGNQVGDSINFGSLVLDADGDAFIGEDSSTQIAGNTRAGRLLVRSAGSITNGNESTINVTGIANFQAATGVNVGTATDDVFNSQTVTGNTTTGNVVISQESDLFLAGDNNANAMTLRSDGTIGNALNANVDVTSVLTLDAGAFISLGTRVDEVTNAEMDRIESGSLNVNTPGDATIESQSAVRFVLSNTAANLTILARDAGTDLNIEDQPDASISVTDSAFFTGLDVILGELDTDCLEAVNDINVMASGIENVVEGCP